MRKLAIAHRAVSPAAELLLGRRARRAPGPQPGPVRILLLNAFGVGGTIRTSLNLAAYLRETHDVEIVSLLRGRDEAFFPMPAGVRVSWLHDKRRDADGPPAQRLLARQPSVLTDPSDPGTRWASLWSDLLLLRWMGRLRGGVLITTRPAYNAFAARFAPAGVTLVGQEHSSLAYHAEDLREELRRTYPRLDLLTALTRGDAAAYAELLGEHAPRIEQIPNAVPELPGDPVPERDRTVVSAGRLTFAKAFDLLIRAFASIAGRHPDWRLEIHGEGDDRPALEALVAELGLGDRIALPGATRDVGALFARCGVFALSSRYEGFPMVLLEAMSKGAPVAAFDCPTGPGDILRDGENGLLLAPEDVGALAGGIERLIEDPDLRRRVGAAARVTAEDYSLEAIGARWSALLDELGHPGTKEGGR